MLKLKEIIQELDQESFQSLEKQFTLTKADHLLYLFLAYRADKLTDAEIIQNLDYSITSFHTLKSRLYDKIQSELTDHYLLDKSDILGQISNIPKFCYETPHEIAEAILYKLEDTLKSNGMSGDLITVYSALKKINLHTQKYYEYSQLYNKHMAYTMALEKAEELFGSFVKALSDYHLSKNPLLTEHLVLIKKEVFNIYQLNKSPHIEIIYNFIVLQLNLFAHVGGVNNEDSSDLLNNIEKILLKFPNTPLYVYYQQVFNFLKFEYFTQINEHNKAHKYFEELNEKLDNWLLLDNLCLAYHFLFSKINTYCRRDMEDSLDAENQKLQYYCDPHHLHSQMNLKYFKALGKFYAGNYHECIVLINELINENSFKDLLHIEIEVKLTLAYTYVKCNEFELTVGIIRSLYRKIKNQHYFGYENAIAFSKMLTLTMDYNGTDKFKSKLIKAIRHFELENTGNWKILSHLEKDLDKFKVTLSN